MRGSSQTSATHRAAIAKLFVASGCALALAAATPAPANAAAPYLTAHPTQGRIKLYERPCDLSSPSDCPSVFQRKRLPAATYLGAPARYLVLASRNRFGRDWLRLKLQHRPNRAAGWAPTELFELREITTKIVVSTSRRMLWLYDGGRLLAKTRVVVGKPSTPTPHGLFALYDLYRTKNDLRPWVLETTAHSNVLKRFQGGPGRVAIHGRNGALAAPLGSAVSNGCIRVPDRPLRLIAKRAERGTPIIIKRS